MKAPISLTKQAPSTDRGNSVELAPGVSELRYRRLFEAAQGGIVILDAQSGKIVDVNPFLPELLDYSFENGNSLHSGTPCNDGSENKEPKYATA
jgi:PAS domain-containing protein